MSDSVKKWYELMESGGWYDKNPEAYRWTSNSTSRKSSDPIVEDVVYKFRERSKIGIEKYGTTLYDSPDGFYKFLNHLQEELMDAILYIEKIKQQK